MKQECRRMLYIKEDTNKKHTKKKKTRKKQLLNVQMFVPALPICTANLVSFPWRTDFSFLGSFCFFLSGSSSSLSGCISTVPPSFVFPTENTGSQRNIQPSKLILQVQSGWFHSYRPTADSEIKARFWINVSLSNKTIFNKLSLKSLKCCSIYKWLMSNVYLFCLHPEPHTLFSPAKMTQ